jgi:imidazolonepropionase-like amidohydrolase
MSMTTRRVHAWQFRLLGLGLCALLLASCTGEGEPPSSRLPDDALIVTGGTVIDGSGAAPIIDGLVALRDGRVLAVGRVADFSFSSDAHVFDVAGGTILPGFIDSHQHETAGPVVRREFLEGGVTSVCSMGSRIEAMARYEEEFLGDLPIARGFQAGPIMTAPGGLPDLVLHLGYNYEVATAGEARAGVADLVERGADVIKVYLYPSPWNDQPIPVLDEDRLEAIVDEAHGRGVLVRAHITDVSVLEMALMAGVDVVDHVPWLKPSEEEVAGILDSDDPIRELADMLAASNSEALLKSMVETDTILVPSLERGIAANFSPGSANAVIELYLDSVRQFHQAGGIIALGTDFNVGFGMTRGIPIGELQLLLDAGLTPMEVIETATRYAARACGHEDEVGTLEPGKLGDLIVVPGNPLQDINALSQISLVAKDGMIAYQPEGS